MQTLLNQLVYFAFFQTIFLLGILCFSSKKRKRVNRYLIILIIALGIGLTGRVFYLSEIFTTNYRWVTFSEFATLLFGATIYLLTKSSFTTHQYKNTDLLHYMPAVIYNIFVTLYFIIPSDKVLEERVASGFTQNATIYFLGIGLLINTTYWVLSLNIFLNFTKKLNDEISYHVKTKFFSYFLFAIGLCILCWILLYVNWIFDYAVLKKVDWQIIWIGIALLMLGLAFYIIKEPKLFHVVERLEPVKYVNSKFSHHQLEALKLKLEDLMENKKPYLNRKLLKSELAEMMGISNPEMARLLNERIGMNFFEYVNYYRIKEFIALTETDKAKHMTFFGLAQDAGFNSKSTFNKSFKALMGSTPKEYFATTK